jgi:hypothetical protein
MRCGYSLHGLPADGCCPECGTAVAWSLRGDLLRYAAPEYVSRLAAGARLVWWSVALALISGIAAVPLVLLAGSMVVLPLVMLALCVMHLGGWWLLSSPDPAATERGEGSRARVVLRGAMIAAIGAWAAESVVVMTPGPVSRAASLPLALAGGGAVLASFVASLLYLRRLAPRLPDPKIRKRAVSLLWIAVAIAGAYSTLAIVDAAAPAGASRAVQRTWRTTALIPVGCGVGLLDLAFVVMYAGMLDRVKAQLNAVLKDARSSGAQPPE